MLDIPREISKIFVFNNVIKFNYKMYYLDPMKSVYKLNYNENNNNKHEIHY